MTATLITEADAGTDEWHAARANGIGASEISAVVGLNPWTSAYALWLEKKGLIPGANPDNPLFDWGHRLEPLVADKFAERHPEFWVMDCGTFMNDQHVWQYANPDRLLFPLEVVPNVTEPLGVLEIKTSRYGDGFGRDGTDEVPLHVRCQVTHQCDVMGVPFGYVAALIGGSDYREYRIEFDETDAAALRDAGAAFWASLATGDEPPVDASFATYEAVKARHPEIDGEDVELSPALYGRYMTTKVDADTATAAHRQAKSELLAAIGTARRALVAGVPVLRRQPGRGGSVSLYPIKES